MKIDIATLTRAVYESFDGLDHDNLMITAHDIIGLNSSRNHFKNDKELKQFFDKLNLVYKDVSYHHSIYDGVKLVNKKLDSVLLLNKKCKSVFGESFNVLKFL
jgi:hypothetical protein